MSTCQHDNINKLFEPAKKNECPDCHMRLTSLEYMFPEMYIEDDYDAAVYDLMFRKGLVK